jgi:hypothetical protein
VTTDAHARTNADTRHVVSESDGRDSQLASVARQRNGQPFSDRCSHASVSSCVRPRACCWVSVVCLSLKSLLPSHTHAHPTAPYKPDRAHARTCTHSKPFMLGASSFNHVAASRHPPGSACTDARSGRTQMRICMLQIRIAPAASPAAQVLITCPLQCKRQPGANLNVLQTHALNSLLHVPIHTRGYTVHCSDTKHARAHEHTQLV